MAKKWFFNPFTGKLDYYETGGGAVWGEIAGNLSNQTDLQSALDAKVPYTGATADLDLGNYNINAMMLNLRNNGSVAFWLGDLETEIGEISGTYPSAFDLWDAINDVKATLDLSQLTIDQIFTFPDQSGTFALAENVVPYSGAVSDLDLGAHNLTVDTNTLFVNSINHRVGIGTTAPSYKCHIVGTLGFNPGSSIMPQNNGDVVIEATNNTTLTFKLKGSDGTVRSATLTLT